jgi:hypothetical protein
MDFFKGALRGAVRLVAACTVVVLALSPAVADDLELGVETSASVFARGSRLDPPISANAQKITTTLQGITFDSNYDNGSLLAVVSAAGTNTFNCTIYTESGERGTAAYWFRFRMTGVAGRAVTLNITHTQNPRPVVSVSGGAFRRTTASEAPSNSKLVLVFGAADNAAEVAFFFPMGYQEMHDRVNSLVAAGTGGTTSAIGNSFQGRQMLMATVTDTGVTDTGKRRVWVHARAHAGEVTASHEALGFLEQILEDSDLGRRLRRHCIFTVVPTENCDGVFLGLTRWDSQGVDPEREWDQSPMIPEVANIKAKVDTLMAGPNPIEVALNLHSTVNDFADTFFFRHLQPSVTANFETIQQRYIDSLDHATPLFDNLDPQTSQLDPSVFIESYFWNHWGESVMAMTHEGHYYQRVTDGAWITDADYRAIGRGLAAAMVEYFSLPPPPTAVEDWAMY